MPKSFVKFDCLICEQMKDIPPEDIAWLEERHLNLFVGCQRCAQPHEISLEDAKWLQERRLGLGFVCRDCSEGFLISPDEVVWLLEHDLKLFKRCPSCRDINKVKRALEEEKAKQSQEEWLEAMKNPEEEKIKQLEAKIEMFDEEKLDDVIIIDEVDEITIHLTQDQEDETVTDGGE